ncbi:P-loop containing nucleoside triphosphate hydrolase protein [Obelidium mucronatum]|nr:P-loop containing nucleoside triphosphate hydrolase protein [Obelidium mucronatum]
MAAWCSDGKEIEPLPRVDHSAIEYIPIEKNLLQEHADITALSEAEVQRIRRELDMRVSGHDIAKPCISFAHFMFEDCLVSTIAKAGFSKPTAIQQQAVPVVLNGRDLIAISKTGSGKTAAFVWPMIVHMMDQPELEWGEGPIGLILAPTRELASQIYTETKKFGKAYSLKSAVVYGGASKTDQFKELRNGGVEILVATPGRLIDLVKMKALNLKRVSFLVLDEADRMFDLGFEPAGQIHLQCYSSRSDKHSYSVPLLRKRIEYLARDVLTDPIRITIGNVGQSNSDYDGYKWNWLTARLNRFVEEGTVIIFIGRKTGVVELAENLSKNGYPCTAFHGDLMQHERDKVIQDCKANRIKILVATDVAARGRAGEKGKAFTLITQKEDRFAADLVQNFEESMLEVPPDLMALAMKNSRFKAKRSGGGGRGGRGGGFGARGRGRGRGGIGFGSSSGGGFGNRGGFSFSQGRGGARGRGGGSIQFQRGGSDWKSTSF